MNLSLKSWFLGIVLLFCFFANGQITVNNTAPYNNPVWLVDNVLVDSLQVVLPAYTPPFSGITLNQPGSIQVGYFDASTTSFPLKSGIVMATAGIDVVVPGAAFTNPSVARPDAELDGVLSALGLTAQTLFDKAVIEFSISAIADSLIFDYVFASNEYANYTCTGFNDVFGFFLTGYGINGNPGLSTINIAQIPNTTVPVAINTVNGGSPTGGGQAINCTNANPNYTAHSIYFNNNPGLNPVNFNGYTSVFKAQAQVQCGNTYHIKLAITDVVDGALNSAVFLGEKSLKAPSYKFTPIPNANNSFTDTAIVEGCSPTPIILEKQGSFLGKDVATKITTGGTAIEGVDYQSIIDSIFMPIGKRFDTIYIQALNDKSAEGPENVILKFSQEMVGCPFAIKGAYEVFIRDKADLSGVASLSGSDTLWCPNDSVQIMTSVSGGDGLTQWWWDDDPSITDSSRYVSPSSDQTYYFYLTDECNTDTILDSISIYTRFTNPLTLTKQTHLVCEGDRIWVEPEISGGSPPYDIVWFDGSTLSEIELEPTRDTNWVTCVVTDLCGVSAIDSILVHLDTASNPKFTYEADLGDPLNVTFTSDPNIRLNHLWDFGDGNMSTDKDPVHRYDDPGEYGVVLSVLTPDSCIKTIGKTIRVEEIYELYIPNAFTPNGDNINDFFTIYGDGVETYEIMIFNRWGQMVFQSNDLENPWDGRVNGGAIQQGVFSYRISVTTTFGGLRERRGTLTLYN